MTDWRTAGPEWLTDANGNTHLYREAPHTLNKHTGHREPPEYPHPYGLLVARSSGNAIMPGPYGSRPLAEWIDQIDPDKGHPVDGDATARLASWHCWDCYVCRTGAKWAYGTEPCVLDECPIPGLHAAGSWSIDQEPRYGDIAHVLYPSGIEPVPANGPHVEVDDDGEPTQTEPEQLDLLDHLAALS